MRIRALIVVATVAFVSHASAAAQDVFATTDDGDVVVLSLDGTWRGATDLEIDAVYGPPPPAAPVGLDRAYSFDTGTGWEKALLMVVLKERCTSNSAISPCSRR